MRSVISRLYAVLMCSVLFCGCAATGSSQSVQAPKIDRISAEELARLVTPPPAKLTLEELVGMSKAGRNAEEIIAQIKATESLYDLTPSQSVELSQQGVPSKVLDYIHNSREAALQNQLADEINRREKLRQAELAKLKNQLSQQRRYYDPFCRGYYGFMPYGYGGYGRHFGSRYGVGAGLGMPLGCW